MANVARQTQYRCASGYTALAVSVALRGSVASPWSRYAVGGEYLRASPPVVTARRVAAGVALRAYLWCSARAPELECDRWLRDPADARPWCLALVWEQTQDLCAVVHQQPPARDAAVVRVWAYLWRAIVQTAFGPADVVCHVGDQLRELARHYPDATGPADEWAARVLAWWEASAAAVERVEGVCRTAPHGVCRGPQ